MHSRGGVERGQGEDVVRAPDPSPEALEFVRYCYRRRGCGWPELYDEMCAVAARAEFRGLGYEQLKDLGIGFALASLPRLARIAQLVVAEERAVRLASLSTG